MNCQFFKKFFRRDAQAVRRKGFILHYPQFTFYGPQSFGHRVCIVCFPLRASGVSDVIAKKSAPPLIYAPGLGRAVFAYAEQVSPKSWVSTPKLNGAYGTGTFCPRHARARPRIPENFRDDDEGKVASSPPKFIFCPAAVYLRIGPANYIITHNAIVYAERYLLENRSVCVRDNYGRRRNTL